MPKPTTFYRPRPVSRCDDLRIAGYRLKFYVISAGGRQFLDDLPPAVESACSDYLADPQTVHDESMLGFVILHLGEHANWLLVDRWAYGDSLRHALFRCRIEGPLAFERVLDPDLCFCVWEASVVDFERRSFMDTMMEEPPDEERYRSTTFEGPA